MAILRLERTFLHDNKMMSLCFILLGMLSGFFSRIFVLNEIMNVSGGHRVLLASLRYFFTSVFICDPAGTATM